MNKTNKIVMTTLACLALTGTALARPVHGTWHHAPRPAPMHHHHEWHHGGHHHDRHGGWIMAGAALVGGLIGGIVGACH